MHRLCNNDIDHSFLPSHVHRAGTLVSTPLTRGSFVSQLLFIYIVTMETKLVFYTFPNKPVINKGKPWVEFVLVSASLLDHVFCQFLLGISVSIERIKPTETNYIIIAYIFMSLKIIWIFINYFLQFEGVFILSKIIKSFKWMFWNFIFYFTKIGKKISIESWPKLV